MASIPRRPDMLVGDTAYGRLTNSGALNIAQAGPHRFAAPIANGAGNTPLVSRNLRATLLSTPGFFDYLPNGKIMAEALQQMLEVSAQSITGLNGSLELDLAKTNIGNAGQQYSMFTNVSRAISQPAYTWNELNGYPYANFWAYFTRMGIGDENSKIPGVCAIPGSPLKASDYDLTFFSFDVLFWEPDPFFTESTQSFLCTAMVPTGTIGFESSMETNRIGETKTFSMTFDCVTEVSLGVKQMADNEIAKLRREGFSSSEMVSLHPGITADVSALEYGLRKDTDSAVSERLT